MKKVWSESEIIELISFNLNYHIILYNSIIINLYINISII